MRKLHYVIMFEITQLINNVKPKNEVYKILITKINKVKIKKLTKLIYAFENKISNLKNFKSKKDVVKKNFKIESK